MSDTINCFYEFGPFRLDRTEHQLLRNGERVPLTPKAFSTLLVLVSRRGRILGKEELMREVWPDTFVEEGGLARNISALRKALDDTSDASRYIETVPKIGYRFVADVKEVSNANGEFVLQRYKDRERRYQTMRDVSLDLDDIRQLYHSGKTTESAVESTAENQTRTHTLRDWPQRKFRVSKPVLIAVASVLIVIIASLLYTFFSRRAPVTSATEIRSLAVLPLVNLSGDPSHEYFADGMTEALIAGLARISALRVTSRTSVMQYKGGQKGIPEIGRELNVDAVIEGSVQRSGDRVRITAQLVRASTDQHLWTQTYDRNLSDVLSLQSEVAGAIAREIQIKLTPQEQARMSGARPINSEAYDSYLRGRYHVVRRGDSENKTAIELFEHAVAIDPNFAIGFSELAQAYTLRLSSFAPTEKQWGEKAFVAVEKALSLDPDLAEAHLARGVLLWTPDYHFPHERAVQEFRRAISLNPNLDEAHHQLGRVYSHIGLLDKALQEVQTAVAINPQNLSAQIRIGEIYQAQGRNEEGLAVFSKYQDVLGPHYQISLAILTPGRMDEASKRIDELLQKIGDDPDGLMSSTRAVVAASLGDNRTAEEMIKRARTNGRGFVHFHHIAYNLACAYALMNKPEPAIQFLEEAAEDGFPCYELFERDHNLDNLRQNPRFITFMAKQKERWEYYKSTL